MTELQHKQLLVATIFSSDECSIDQAIVLAERIIEATTPQLKPSINFNVGLEGITEHNDY